MKLIRNRIPEIAAKNGAKLKTRQALPGERWTLLKQKLLEEAKEMSDAIDGSEAEVDELADVIEVVEQLRAELEMLEHDKVVNRFESRRAERGEVGFLVLLNDGET